MIVLNKALKQILSTNIIQTENINDVNKDLKQLSGIVLGIKIPNNLSSLSQRSYNSLTDKPDLNGFITKEDNISGIANKANKLNTSRKIQLSGAVVGSVQFDGSKDVILTNALDNITISADDIQGLSISWNEILNKPDFSIYENKIQKIKVDNQELEINQQDKSINIDLSNKADLSSIPSNSDFTLAGLSQKSYNNLTDKPNLTSFITKDDNISGIAAKANKLNAARKIQLSGVISGYSYFDGSQDIIIKNTLDNIKINAEDIQGLDIYWNDILNIPSSLLSCNFTDQYQQKLIEIQNGAQTNKIQKIKVDNQELEINQQDKSINIDLSNKADLSSIPSNNDFALSSLSQKSYNSLDDLPNLTNYENKIEKIIINNQELTINQQDKSINIDLSNKADLSSIPSNSDFTLDGLSQKSYNNLTDKPTLSSYENKIQKIKVNNQELTINTNDKSVNIDLSNKADLSSIPSNSDFALSSLSQRSYNSLTDKPILTGFITKDDNISGIAAKANKLNTAKKIQLSGAVVGSVYFDGSKDIVITNALCAITVNASDIQGLSIYWDDILDKPDNLCKFTDLYQQKLIEIQNGAQVNKIQKIKVNNQELTINTNDKSINIDLSNKADLSSIPSNSDFTLAGLSQKSYNNLTDKPTLTSFITKDDNISGIAAKANKLNIARKIQLDGVVSGYALFDGSQDIKINTDLDNLSIPSNSDFTLAGLSQKSYNNLTDKPTLSSYENKIQKIKVDNQELLINSANKSVNIDIASYITAHNTSLAAHTSGFNHDIILNTTSNNNTYKTWLRNDGSNFYVLLSNANGSSWNGNYPLFISYSSGNAVTIGTPLTVKNNTTFNSNIAVSGVVTATSGFITNISSNIIKVPNIHGQTLELGLYNNSSSNNGGCIDFHYNNSTADYTARIIESPNGVISISPKLYTPSANITTIKTSNGYITNIDATSGFITNIKSTNITTTNNYSTNINTSNINASNINCTCVELGKYNTSSSNHGGYIDFHYNGSTTDYTARIIEIENGLIQIEKKIKTQEIILHRDGYKVYLASPNGHFFILFSDLNGASYNSWRPFQIDSVNKKVIIPGFQRLPNYDGMTDITSAWSTGVWTATANGWILIGTAGKDDRYSLYAGANADKLVFHIGNHDEYVMTSYPIRVLHGQKYTLKKNGGSSGYQAPATGSATAPTSFVYFIPER